jgi:hypothetical protein
VVTVSVAAPEVTGPELLVNTTRYWLPLSPSAVADVVYVVVTAVRPGWAVACSVTVGLSGAADHVVPPSVETCQATVGVVVPSAAAVKAPVFPTTTEVLAGWVVTVGGAMTLTDPMAAAPDVITQVYKLLPTLKWIVRSPTTTLLPAAPLMGTVVAVRPVHVADLVPVDCVVDVVGAARAPPGTTPETTVASVTLVVGPPGPVAGSMCKVRATSVASMDPTGEVGGRVPEAVSVAATDEKVSCCVVQESFAPAGAGPTVNVVVICAGS